MNKPTAAKVVTGRVRLSYAHLFEPYASRATDTPKYSVCLLIPKSDTVTVEKIKKAVEAATETGKSSKWGGKVPKALKTPLRDGDEEREAPEYKNHYFINANSNQAPGVVDVSLNKIIDPAEVYSGCYAHVSVSFYPFSVGGNNGVGCGLNNVQKIADGERLAGKPAAEADFTAVSEDFLT